MAAGHSVDPPQWGGPLDAGLARGASRFARVEPLRTVAAPFGGHRHVEHPVATEPEVAGSLTPAPAFLSLRRPRPRVLDPPSRRSTEQLSESLPP